ncbi:MAG: hypothetical protein V4625_19210 [Pseudomonadota bacterium]
MKGEKLRKLQVAIAQELAGIDDASSFVRLLNQIAAYELGQGPRPAVDDFLQWLSTADSRQARVVDQEQVTRQPIRRRNSREKSDERLAIEHKSRTALGTPPNPSARKNTPFSPTEWETPATRKSRQKNAGD